MPRHVSACAITVAIAITSTFGCNKTEDNTNPTQGKGSAATLAPTVPTTSPAAGTHEEHMPAWYAQVPQHAVMVKPGDTAWALVPYSLESEATRATVVEIVSVEGDTATVRDVAMPASGAQAYRHHSDVEARTMKGIPALLLIAARSVDTAQPKRGDLDFVFRAGAPNPPLARIKSTADDLATYDVANTNGDKVVEEKTDIVEPYGKGIAPFTYTAVNTGGQTTLLFVMAVDGDMVYGKSLAGTFEKVRRADCKSVTPSAKDRKAGDTVVAFPFGGMMVEGKIDKVRVPGQIYEINGRPVTWDFVFDKM